MKILGLVGSPRRGGNTDLMVDAILKGAADKGYAAEKVYLYDVNIEPCVDCRACKQGSLRCVFQDGMQTLYPKLETADVVVFGTPLYWYGASATMKLLVDRLRPYIASKKLAGKKAVVVVPSEEGADACSHIVAMFSLSFRYLGMELAGVLLPKAYEKAEVRQNPQVLSDAEAVGRSLG
ncbi:MAG: flavodoxin family protein [Candidatus Bathyarchaeota archaeon]|nr:flavodoxin family protein [Candidatus Bathyarchaeota archaeon]